MNDKGFTVVASNRTPEKIDEFLAGPAKGQFFSAATTPACLH
jgi:6-phosphogluconate dehydrogenase